MLFTLSSSLLLLVAGSTVRASPVPQFFEQIDLLSAPVSTSTAPFVLGTGLTVPHSATQKTVSLHSTTAKVPTVTPTSIKGPSVTPTLTKGSSVTLTSVKGPSVTPTTTKAATISKPATVTSAKGGAGSTFTVPISTPHASKESSIGLHTASAISTASAKATVTPTKQVASPSGTSLASGAQCDGTNDGIVVCSADGSLFGLCDHGAVVMRPVSKGTACRNGAIDYIADVLTLALGQVKSYVDSSENTTATINPANPSAIDASDCPAALMYLKDKVDAADSTTGSEDSATGLRFVAGSDKTVVDDSDIELVRKPDGSTGFQVSHQCGSATKGNGNAKRQFYLDLCIL